MKIIILSIAIVTIVGFTMSTVMASSQTVTIPEWVKNNAAWWADDQIDDNTFASGIEYMIKQGIIIVPATESGEQNTDAVIPGWVKNNAAWWADDQIDDNTFASGIQFLIKTGIIIVQQQETEAIPSTPQITDNVSDYTILVYMVGSDLESRDYAATTDLGEMLEVDLPSSVNVIVETGGANAKPDDYRFADFTIVQRWYIDGYDESYLISELGPKNMGTPSTLSDFLIWGTQEFPAKKFALILWDHGGGISGFGNDEMYDMDETDLDEFAVALSSAYQETGVTFELIGFDQCLMATIEVASVIENYANYMVASEEIEPGHGWDYTAILSSLKNNSNQNGKDLGKVIVDSYFAHTKAFDNEYGTQEQRMITLSVIDLAKIDSLNNAINELETKTVDAFTNNQNHLYSFGQTLLNSERYGQQARSEDSGHTDLKDFVTNIAYYIPQVSAEAEKVKALVSDAVVYNKHGQTKPNSNGLSIHMQLTSEQRQILTTQSQVIQDVSEDYQNFLESDNDYPTLEYEIIDGKIYGQFGGDDIYSFKLFITSKDLIVIEGATEIMAIEEYNPNEYPGGEFVIDWDGYLPALCDENYCAPMNSELYFNDDIVLEYVPVLLESSGVQYDVDLIYDSTDWYNPVFLGALPYNEDESIIERDLWPLYLGDIIYTYTADYNFETGESELFYYEEDPIIVDEYLLSTSGLEYYQFDGTFELLVEVCDFSYNCVITDPIGPYIPVAPLE